MLKLPSNAGLSGRRGGYAFLVGVMAMGAIGAATTVSMLLLGLAAQQSGATIVDSAQSWEYAHTCVERALGELRNDPAYAGEQEFAFARGTCTIYSISGSGNENRAICAEGVSGDITRHLQVDVKSLFPSVVIRDWQEVSTFTLCR